MPKRQVGWVRRGAPVVEFYDHYPGAREGRTTKTKTVFHYFRDRQKIKSGAGIACYCRIIQLLRVTTVDVRAPCVTSSRVMVAVALGASQTAVSSAAADGSSPTWALRLLGSARVVGAAAAAKQVSALGDMATAAGEKRHVLRG